MARTQDLDLLGEIALLVFGDDLPPEITCGRRALAMAYKWLGRARRSVIDMLFTSYFTIGKAPSSSHLQPVGGEACCEYVLRGLNTYGRSFPTFLLW